MQHPRASTQLDEQLDLIDETMYANPEETVRLCLQVFDDARRLKEPLAHAIAAERYGLVMDHLGRGVKARDALFDAVQAAQSAGLYVNEARLLEQIARGYYTAGEYRQAIQYWAQCIDISNQAGRDARTWILAKVGLGSVYFAMDDFESGLALLKEAESRIGEVDDPHLDAKIKINQGVGLAKTNRRKEATGIFLRALAICERHDYYDYSAESNFRLAEVEVAEGEYDAALAHLALALPLTRRVKYRWGESYLLAIQAEAHAGKGDYAGAMRDIRAAQELSIADDFWHMLIQQHFAAARYAKATGDFDTALAEFRAGYDFEQRMQATSARERNELLEEKAGLRPSVSRLLMELAGDHSIGEGRLDVAFKLIARESSRILKVQRGSIWLLDMETGRLVCRSLYLADRDDWDREPDFRRRDLGDFFDRIESAQPLAAHDALHHPHTCELADTYLAPRNIRSMLVVPLRLGGKTAGTLCVEAVGAQRNWTPDDLTHGNQLAQVAARALASHEHNELRREITALNTRVMQANETLEARVIERTTSLERHNAELHALNDRRSELRDKLAQAKAVADLGERASKAVPDMQASLQDVASRLKTLDTHHAALTALLRDYESARARAGTVPASGADKLQAALADLTQATLATIVDIEASAAKLSIPTESK